MAKTNKYVVFIDLDKTLLTINSGKVLIKEAFNKELLPKAYFAKAIFLSVAYKFALLSPERVTLLMSKFLKGIPETAVKALAADIVNDKLRHNLRTSIIKEIEQHRKKDAQIVILSAALSYTCKALAKHLGIDDVICSTMKAVDGIFTGKPKGRICIGKEKAEQLSSYCHEKSFKIQDAYYYGDSYSDRFAFEIVGNPVCVAPDKKLHKLAEQKQMRIIE